MDNFDLVGKIQEASYHTEKYGNEEGLKKLKTIILEAEKILKKENRKIRRK